VSITQSKNYREGTGIQLWLSTLLTTDKGLELKVGGVTGDRQDPHRIGVAKAALPPLDCNDRASGLNHAQAQANSQAISDAVVHLFPENTLAHVRLRSQDKQYSRLSATDDFQCLSVRGTTQGNRPCADGADERSVRYE
jgi:hypothetical protein